MNKTLSKIFFLGIPVGYLVLVILYIILVIRPELIFHHLQPPFIASPDYIFPFMKYPGGAAELLANLILQSFYSRFAGSFVFLALAFIIGWLMSRLIDSIYKSELNRIWALAPFILTIALTNNYNFPFSIIVSIAFILLILLVITKTGKGFASNLLLFTFGAIMVYWFAGSGYFLLFSIMAIFISSPLRRWLKTAYIIYILAFAFLFPLLASNFLFAIPLKYQYFWFYAPKPWFMRYEPASIFVFYLVLMPFFLAAANIVAVLNRRKSAGNPKPGMQVLKTSFALFIIFAVTFVSHFATFNSDSKKIVEADYYCYQGNAEKTAKAATSLKNYNFAANLNFNLVMSKTGRLTENFFRFLQIKGNEALYPDVEFASDLSFIASDFYFDLGFITEARHWAYEALVFYPYSVRAMQNLVKIHLVTGEYKAAERTLKILEKGIIDREFVREYLPYITDTTLIATNRDLMDKRSFIPVEGELNPLIDGRFRELLEANGNNKKAYESLMLFYLLDAQLENFLELYKNVGQYFDKIPAVYEEALLMTEVRTGQPLPADIRISAETQNRYNRFMEKLEQYKGNTRLARNSLYAEYGKTYLYFLQFVYPNIITPEIINDEEDYPAI
jgi:hypothetical protein